MVPASTMLSLSFLSLLAILPAALAFKASILFPLYIYPGAQAVAWNPLFNYIGNYSRVQFQVIVNPSNGPGTTQDPNYIYGLQKLNSYSNVLVYGYVDTSFGNYNVSHIERDLDLWKNYNASAPTGIFFDDVSTNNSTVNTIMQQVTTYAVSNDHFDATQIVFNCGALPPKNSVLYTSAAQIVIYENVYTSNTSVVAQSGATQGKITALFYSGSTVTSAVNAEVNLWCGLVDSLFITNLGFNAVPGGPYGAFGSQLGAFVAAMNASTCPH